MELGREIPVPVQHEKRGNQLKGEPASMMVHNYRSSRRLALPNWVVQTLLDMPVMTKEKMRLGVYADYQKGYLYLEPGLGPIRLQDLEEIRGFKDKDIWKSFQLLQVRQLLDPPPGHSFYPFRVDVERGRIRLSYDEKPSKQSRVMTLKQRRRIFL